MMSLAAPLDLAQKPEPLLRARKRHCPRLERSHWFGILAPTLQLDRRSGSFLKRFRGNRMRHENRSLSDFIRAHEESREREFPLMRIICNYWLREAMLGGLFLISESNWLDFNTCIRDAVTITPGRISIPTDPVALIRKGICGQRNSPGILRKQRLIIQQISLDIEVGDRCQMIQVRRLLWVISTFLNALISESCQRNMLCCLAFLNL